jgi:asparagine synthase (glutamine-hydrolysing)
MCGIAGIVLAPRAPGRADKAVALEMARALRHRGPDGERAWAGAAPLGPGRILWRAALGHARLAVIDRSEAASEPFLNEDATLLLVFNGEIYNHRALRGPLEAAGHRFQSRCDAEVALHLYEERGRAAPAELSGMFAFGILDVAKGRLLLARDPAGKKPLYFAAIGEKSRPEGLLFASEPLALFAAALSGGPEIPREPDREALEDFLAVGYIPAPRTAFGAIQKLEPGTALVLEDGRIEIERFSRFCPRSGEGFFAPEIRGMRAASRAVRAAVLEAVRARLEAEVPIGAFLSGGIDSTIVAGLARRELGYAIETFSIGFDDPRFDERRFARLAARRLGTEHCERVLDASSYGAIADVVLRHGEPFADESAIATYHLAAFARERVTVALTGDGGDELFLGYRHHRAARALARLDRVLPRAARRLLARLAPPPGKEKSLRRQIARLIAALGENEPRRYLFWTGIFPERGERIARLLTAAGGIERYDLEVYLPEDLLAKLDRATMAHGLEARSPLLDRDLARLSAAIPARLKAPNVFWGKKVLAEAFCDLLPPETLSRSKMGFGVPVGTWFRGALRPLVRDLLLSERALSRGFFLPEAVRALVEEHERGEAEHGRRLHALFALEVFFRTYVDLRRPARYNL